MGREDGENLLKGNMACRGCAMELILRYVLKAAGEDAYLIIGAGCAPSCQGIFPFTSYNINVLNMPFAAPASGASGVVEALRKQGRDSDVIAFLGDGGTGDIGLSAVSGAMERNHDMLYVCYDNEAYCNTGFQRSGATPLGAITRTTPAGKKGLKKDLGAIFTQHRIPYVATAVPSYVEDLYRKLKKGLEVEGSSFIHVLSPCPQGWGFPPAKSISVGRKAVQSGSWSLYEAFEDGRVNINKPSKKAIEDPLPVKDYIEIQDRFQNLTDEKLKIHQKIAGENLDWMRRKS